MLLLLLLTMVGRTSDDTEPSRAQGSRGGELWDSSVSRSSGRLVFQQSQSRRRVLPAMAAVLVMAMEALSAGGRGGEGVQTLLRESERSDREESSSRERNRLWTRRLQTHRTFIPVATRIGGRSTNA